MAVLDTGIGQNVILKDKIPPVIEACIAQDPSWNIEALTLAHYEPLVQ